MENASKALIIAGAILISIVIISLGVVIIGQGQDVVNQSSMDDQVVSTWNQKWTQYEGSQVSGSNVNTLLNEIISSNTIAIRDKVYDKCIVVTGDGVDAGKIVVTTEAANNKTGTPAYTKNATTKAKPGRSYIVSITGYSNAGYVNAIKVTAK